jgi:hypothetical protein
LQELGIKGIKVDFFGGDGQSMMAYYHDILIDAANFGLLVNFHGATIPRGWHRTYPHLMTMESIRGFEFITFFQETADLAPRHCAIIPFTRNVFDPMDFTPMTFGEIPGINRKTTVGFELALPTLFLSGIQHMAETPMNMAKAPHYVKDYLSQLPVKWEESKLLDGYPGEFVIMARRFGSDWYISGINADTVSRKVHMDLSFISSQTLQVITDGNERNSFQSFEICGENNSTVALNMQPYGGFVIKSVSK